MYSFYFISNFSSISEELRLNFVQVKFEKYSVEYWFVYILLKKQFPTCIAKHLLVSDDN